MASVRAVAVSSDQIVVEAVDVDTAALVSGAEPCHTSAARFSAAALAAGTNAGA